MPSVVGLDIGTRTLTGAVFSGRPGNYRLTDFFVENIPSIAAGRGGDDELDTPVSLQDLLTRVVAEHGLKLADVVVAVDTKDCVVREFSVPFTREEQIGRTIEFEAETHFPGVDIEDVTLEHLKVGEVDGKSQLVVWALRDDLLQKRLELVQGTGVDPVAVDLDAAALFNAYAESPVWDPDRTTLLVEMGSTSTRIVLVEKGQIRKIRALRLEAFVAAPERLIPEPAADSTSGESPEVSVEVVGGQEPAMPFASSSIEARLKEIEEALQRLDPSGEEPSGAADQAEPDPDDAPIAILSDEDYDLIRADDPSVGEDDGGDSSPGSAPPDAQGGASGEEPAEAGAAPQFPGQGSAERVFDYREYLQRIAIEIQRSLISSSLTSPVELICLTGGMSGREEARIFFSEEFDVETIHLDFGESLSAELPPRQQSGVNRFGAVAVGLGLKLLGGDRAGLDFRKGRFRYEHRFARLRIPVLVAASLFFLFSLQATFWAIQDWKEEKQRVGNYQAWSTASYKAFFGTELVAGRDPYQAALSQKRAWTGKGAGRTDRFLDVAAVVGNLGEVMREAGMYFRLTRADLKFRARPSTVGAGRKKQLALKADASKLDIETPDRRAIVKLENAFRSPRSRYFDCKASSPSATREGDRKVTMDLNVKSRVLRDLK